MHEVLRVGDHPVRLMRATVPQLVDDELRLVHAHRGQRPHTVRRRGVHEGGQHVAHRDRVQRRRHKDGERRFRGHGAHRVLGGERVGEHLGERTVVSDRARQDVANLLPHQRLHDAALHEPAAHRRLDRPRAAHGVDRPHVQRVSPLDPFPRARHPQRGAENRRLEIVHRHRVPAQEGAHVAVLDEPHHVFAGPRVHEGGADDPHDAPAPVLLFTEQLREDGVVDGPLARHFGLHEPELVGAVPPAEEPLGVDEDALAAVLSRCDRNLVVLAHLARLRGDQLAPGRLHDHTIHARQARPPPRPVHLHVGRQVARGEETVGENAVGGG